MNELFLRDEDTLGIRTNTVFFFLGIRFGLVHIYFPLFLLKRFSFNKKLKKLKSSIFEAVQVALLHHSHLSQLLSCSPRRRGSQRLTVFVH